MCTIYRASLSCRDVCQGKRSATVPNGQVTAAPGSQTLARGLTALQVVADAPAGLTVQQVADHVGVHRTIAYRLLTTLAQFRFVTKGDDGRYRSAAGSRRARRVVRQQRAPAESCRSCAALADDLGTTVSLLVAEGDQQVAIAVIVPDPCRLPAVVPRGQSLSTRPRAPPVSPCWPACRPGPASATWSRRPVEQRVGDHPRRDRAEHLRSRGPGAPRPAVAADLHQLDLASRRRRRCAAGMQSWRPPSNYRPSSADASRKDSSLMPYLGPRNRCRRAR